MNCNYAQSRISAYVDGELAGGEMLNVRAHLAACENCKAAYENCLNLKRAVSSMPDHSPSPEFQHRLVNAIRRAAPSAESEGPIWPTWRMAVAFAAAAVAAFAVLYFRSGSVPESAVPSAGDEIALDQDWNTAAGAFPANTLPAGLEGN
jgi:anti-sigma factor RsiW